MGPVIDAAKSVCVISVTDVGNANSRMVDAIGKLREEDATVDSTAMNEAMPSTQAEVVEAAQSETDVRDHKDLLFILLFLPLLAIFSLAI